MAEVLTSSQAVIDAKLDQWNVVLTQQAESRDQTEQVRDHTDTELRQSYDNLRSELQVDDIYVLVPLFSISHNNYTEHQRRFSPPVHRYIAIFELGLFFTPG